MTKMRRISSSLWSMMAVIFSDYRIEDNMLHHHSVTRPADSLFRVRSVSLVPKQPKSKSKEDLPQLVRRLVEYGWDYDRICLRVERQFPPPASDRTGTAEPSGMDRVADRAVSAWRNCHI